MISTWPRRLACLAAAVIALIWVLYPLEPFQHYLALKTGTLNEPGEYYGFWSGFGSVMERLVELAVIGAILLWKHNCHQPGCPYPGKFPAVEGGGWHYCRKHHTTGGVHVDPPSEGGTT